MSNEIAAARQKLKNIPTLLRAEKLLSAIIALQSALMTISKSSLMRSEREEFDTLLNNSVHHISMDREFTKLCENPAAFKYKRGEEQELYKQLSEFTQSLQKNIHDDAHQKFEEKKRNRAIMFAAAKEHLQEGRIEKANALFPRVARDAFGDYLIFADIADCYIQEKMHTEALPYLKVALELNPTALHLYNKLAISLRKLEQFSTAEQYYKHAIKLCAIDEYLLFNISRLYADWGKWKLAEKMARRSIDINPDFEEAHKMVDTALYQQEELEKQFEQQRLNSYTSR